MLLEIILVEKDRRVAHLSSSLSTLGLIAHPVLQSLVFESQSPCVILPRPSCSSSGVQGNPGISSAAAEHNFFAGVGEALVSVLELKDKAW